MSVQLVSVAECVAALCSAYHSGATLLQKIKKKRKGLNIAAQDLELSITRGEAGVRGQYELVFSRYGETFAHGDRIARDALKGIIPRVNIQINQNLETYYHRDITIDFTALQDVCDSSQDGAILVFMQLEQRLMTPDLVDAVIPTPVIATNSLCRRSPTPACQLASKSTCTLQDTVTPASECTRGTFPVFSKSEMSSSPAITPSNTPYSRHLSSRPESSLSQVSIRSSNMVRRAADPYKPMAISVAKPGFLGIGKRTTMQPMIFPPENPLVDEYFADALETNADRISRSDSLSTISTSHHECEHQAHNAWQNQQAPSPTSPPIPYRNDYLDLALHISSSSREALTSNQLDSTQNLLPSEQNGYAGFCKGAWRQQIGDVKRAMQERVRPGGMYNQAKYWKCRQCKFEGHLIPTNEKEKAYDMRVFKLVDGIQFRWEFMFKSHVASKDLESNPTKATFACIFCCSEARGAPTFGGIQNFMNHLLEHRDPLPMGEVLHRMNCLVGRQAALNENFDINFVSLERG